MASNPFQPFDLASVFQNAEVIKGMRRQSTMDDLQAQYLQGQIGRAGAQEQRAVAQEGRASTEFNQEQQVVNTRLLNMAAAEVAENPSAASRWDPIIKAAIPDWEPAQGDPAQIQAAAKQLYESTSQALQAYQRSGTGNAVQSTKIGENGNIWQVLRDGTMRDTGVKAQGGAVQFRELQLPDGRTVQGTQDPNTGTIYGVDGAMLAPPIRGSAPSGPVSNAAPPGLGTSRAPEDEAAAKRRAEAQVDKQIDFPRLEQNANESMRVIDQLKAHPGLPYITGLYSKAPIVPGTDQAAADALAKQIAGRTFLEAYNTLKGGGQITEVEGTKAQEAIGRLSRAQSTEDYTEALDELRSVLSNGLERARRQASTPQGAEAGSMDFQNMTDEQLRELAK